ncbi:hypothetical protein RRG08_029864 [Elysia crispata]|uniref:Uncharacterized protein n=1 Tax=Elysia crispata TaxID=231223 RepID=A0AAE0YKB1_9GAST|nr:hypothetical protein RRG08_029864 [Elysia crispata]
MRVTDQFLTATLTEGADRRPAENFSGRFLWSMFVAALQALGRLIHSLEARPDTVIIRATPTSGSMTAHAHNTDSFVIASENQFETRMN